MRHWTPWRLSLGLGWLLLWTALVVVLHLAFAGSQPRRGALPMKAVLHTQDAKAAACQPACYDSSDALV